MKKLLSKVLTLLFITIFFASCSKCVDCGDCPDGVTIETTELCQNAFDNKDEYDQAVALIEAFGCECK